VCLGDSYCGTFYFYRSSGAPIGLHGGTEAAGELNYNNERNDSVTLTHESSSPNGLRTAEKVRNNAVNTMQ